MSQFIIYLDGVRRSPAIRFDGKSGKTHHFRWCEAHRAMIHEGKELSSEEFAKVAPDIFAAEFAPYAERPVPKIVSESAPDGALRLPAFTGSEFTRLCARIGELEIENARLNAEITFQNGGKPPTAVQPPKQDAPVPTPPPAQGFTDFDPDAALPASPLDQIVLAAAKGRAVGPAIPSQDLAPGLGAGDYDPDEVAFDASQHA